MNKAAAQAFAAILALPALSAGQLRARGCGPFAAVASNATRRAGPATAGSNS